MSQKPDVGECVVKEPSLACEPKGFLIEFHILRGYRDSSHSDRRFISIRKRTQTFKHFKYDQFIREGDGKLSTCHRCLFADELCSPY